MRFYDLQYSFLNFLNLELMSRDLAVLYTASPVQNFTEIDNRLRSYGQKMIFKMAAVRHLEFLNFSYLVI